MHMKKKQINNYFFSKDNLLTNTFLRNKIIKFNLSKYKNIINIFDCRSFSYHESCS